MYISYQNLINGLGCTAESWFMILHKMAYVMDQNDRKLELHDNL
jgi:hypothetical protein